LAVPNLAELEVAKSDQDSKKGAAMTETRLSLGNVITIDDERITTTSTVVRGSVEETFSRSALSRESC
jgi:hypothetical protein